PAGRADDATLPWRHPMPTPPTRPPLTHWRLLAPLALLLSLLLPLAGCGGGSPTGTGCKAQANSTATPGEGGGGPTAGSCSPRQMRIAYGVQSLCEQGYTGAGQTVVLIESFGSPRLQPDVDDFSKRFNLPPIKLDIRAPIGVKPFDSQNQDMVGWAVETTLDAE